jgi:GH15 family glucan-1,4-alpha-glucosidase
MAHEAPTAPRRPAGEPTSEPKREPKSEPKRRAASRERSPSGTRAAHDARARQRVDGYAPIGSYAALGDGRTIALVARDGSIDWLPPAGMDGAPVFGALLDPVLCGRFALAPIEEHEVRRGYVEGSNVLETTFETPGGTVTVTDSLNLQDGGQLSWVELVRRVRAVDGRVRMRYELEPRFDFGAGDTALELRGDAILASCGPHTMAFRSWDAGEPSLAGERIAGELELRAGDEALLACVFAEGQPVPLPPRREIEVRLQRSAEAWRRWLDFHCYEGPWRESVDRSLLALKLLTTARTGAIAAAATTSLPERIGAHRNYDYRYAWIRDSAFALDALGTAGYREQVHASLSWVLAASAPTHPRMEPFYTLDRRVPRGQRRLALAGYRGSQPVLEGNGASGQLQLGCYGNLLETIELYVRHGNTLDADTRVRVGEVADHVCRIWEKPDSGIWELPEQRHYTASKINCWVALDRATKLGERGEAPADRLERWREQAHAIRAWIDRRCWSDAQRAYAFHAGSDELDAAVLLAARAGFLAADDERLISTVRAVRRELGAGGPLLYRYSGQRHVEGAFLACSFWLVEALARVGQLEDARQTMQQLLALSNDVGLYAEEIDPSSGEMLGNFPQALTHLSLVNAASACAQAQRKEREDT